MRPPRRRGEGDRGHGRPPSRSLQLEEALPNALAQAVFHVHHPRPAQHHLRLHMYIAQARGGRFEIVETLGAIDPQERQVTAPALAG